MEINYHDEPGVRSVEILQPIKDGVARLSLFRWPSMAKFRIGDCSEHFWDTNEYGVAAKCQFSPTGFCHLHENCRLSILHEELKDKNVGYILRIFRGEYGGEFDQKTIRKISRFLAGPVLSEIEGPVKPEKS